MAKYTRTFLWLAILLMFLLIPLMQGYATLQLQLKPKTISTVRLVSLSCHGQPSSVMVPAELPIEFISHANDLIVQYELNIAFSTIVFASRDWIITVFACENCCKFMLMDYYDIPSETSKTWMWNPAGDIKRITDKQWTSFMENLTSELAAAYCIETEEN